MKTKQPITARSWDEIIQELQKLPVTGEKLRLHLDSPDIVGQAGTVAYIKLDSIHDDIEALKQSLNTSIDRIQEKIHWMERFLRGINQ
jgi:hypothetical protein